MVKAVIIRHGQGGVYVLDRQGSFRFIIGHRSKAIGTEIDVSSRSVFRFPQAVAVAVCIVFATALLFAAWMWNANRPVEIRDLEVPLAAYPVSVVDDDVSDSILVDVDTDGATDNDDLAVK